MTLDKKSRFIIQIYKPIERTDIFGINDDSRSSDEGSLEDIDIKDGNDENMGLQEQKLESLKNKVDHEQIKRKIDAQVEF